MWDRESAETHAFYNHQADYLDREYRRQVERIEQERQLISEELSQLANKCSFEKRVEIKRVSAFEVYVEEALCESAKALLKQLKLTKEEKEIIAMNPWNALTDQERYTYELKARYHNEKAKFKKVSQFYDERIQSGKKHHPLPEMTDIFTDVLSQMSVTTHQQKEIETSALDQAMIEKSTQD